MSTSVCWCTQFERLVHVNCDNERQTNRRRSNRLYA